MLKLFTTVDVKIIYCNSFALTEENNTKIKTDKKRPQRSSYSSYKLIICIFISYLSRDNTGDDNAYTSHRGTVRDDSLCNKEDLLRTHLTVYMYVCMYVCMNVCIEVVDIHIYTVPHSAFELRRFVIALFSGQNVAKVCVGLCKSLGALYVCMYVCTYDLYTKK